MNITLDIEATVAAAITEALDPQRLQEVVKGHVTKLVDEVISDQFSNYGDFSRKTLEPAIKQLLPHSLTLGDTAAWTHYLQTAITEQVQAYNEERFQQALAPLLDNLLTRPPATIKLSELVDKAVEAWKDHYCRGDGHDQPTVIVRHGYPSAGGIWISMDPRSNQSAGACQVAFGVTGSGQGLRVYGLRVGGAEAASGRFVGSIYGFESYLLALQTEGSTLVIDGEDFSDVYYPGSDGD